MMVLILIFSCGVLADDAKEVKKPTVIADMNGDKIFDNLEDKLADVKGDFDFKVIVQLNEDYKIENIEKIVGAFKLKYKYQYIEAFAGTLNKGQIIAMSKMPFVKNISLDRKVKAFNNTATYWHEADEVANDFGFDGDRDGNPASYSIDDVVVSVIDTGIDASHVDLDNDKVIYFKDWVNGDTLPYDDHGHGTHCAGTIAGTGDSNSDYKGVAPGSALIGLKVLDQRGSGSTSDIDAAIEWCINNKDQYGIDVISMSLGSSGSSDGTDSTSILCNQAMDSGIVTVVAAGNSGPDTYTIGSPAASEKAITVGAIADVGENGYFQANFSSRGPTADGRIKPDVSAPGYYVMSVEANTTDGYTEMSGTSMATPYTAGTVALMLDANPNLTTTEVKNKIMDTSFDLGVSGKDVDYGYGRIDTHEAVKAAANLSATGINQPDHTFDNSNLSGSGDYVEYTIYVDNLDYPIGLTLIMFDWEGSWWPFGSGSPDFDLYLYDSSGNQVAASEGTTRQEQIGYQPTGTGTYTVRVYSYSGDGEYSIDISY